MNIFGGQDIEDRSGVSPLLIQAGFPITVYSDAEGTTEVTDLFDLLGDPITGLTVTVTSQCPYFTIADQTVTKLYLSVNGSTPSLTFPVFQES